MGSGVSLSLDDPRLAFWHQALAKPLDGSDISTLEQGRDEIKRMRKQLREVLELETTTRSYESPLRREADLARTKMTSTTNTLEDEMGNMLWVNQYEILHLLGHGSFGVVHKCRDHETGQVFAIKVLNKKRLKRKRIGRFENALTNVEKEVAVWKKLRHENIVTLREVIDDADSDDIYLVSDYVDGGCLMPDVMECQPLAEDEARHAFYQLIEAVDYLHRQGVIHRDIKPGNMLYDKGRKKLLLSDFGVAHAFRSNEDSNEEDAELISTAGTAMFLAPEMLTGEPFHGRPTDLWACGVSLFMMVTGKMPFKGTTLPELYENIQIKELEFPGSANDLSPQVRDLITKLLDKDPLTRATIQQVRAHQWFERRKAGRTQSLPLTMNINQSEISRAITPLHSTMPRTTRFVVEGKRLYRRLISRRISAPELARKEG